MTIDTYHTLVGGIFIAMMVGFLIARTKNILVDLLISAVVSVWLAQMIRDGYRYASGIISGVRIPWGMLRTVLLVVVLVVAVLIVVWGFVWLRDRINDRRTYHYDFGPTQSVGFTQPVQTQQVYIAPPPPPPPNLPNIVDKSLLNILSYPDGSPRRIFHGTSLEAAKDIIHYKRIKISAHANGMWGSADFTIALDYAQNKGGETGVIIEFSVSSDVVLDDQGSNIYVVPVPGGTPGKYFWFGKQFSPVAVYDQSGRKVTI